ncbi:MAG: transcriptional repressor [Anaerolineae bacterium]|nr:transcriptional repressor [Anaerolineae bacterium]
MNNPSRLDRLRDAGYKLTNARTIVLNVIETHEGHMTSAEILDAVAVRDSSIGRASVFRTLDLLTRLAIIRPTYTSGSATPNYVLMPDGHHHHIVCVQCHQTIEFEDCGLATLGERLEDEFGVKLTGHLLEFYGVCGTCNEADVVDDEG